MSASRNNVKRSNITACRRCRTRKQRCDQDLPACGNCTRAGVECVGVGADGLAEPRSYIKSLEDYVAQLEQRLAFQEQIVEAADVQNDHLDRSLMLARTAVAPKGKKAPALELPVLMQVTIPEHDVLMALSQRYFEHSDFFSPILDHSDMEQLSKAARGTEAHSHQFVRSRFVVFMMLSTTMELLQRSESNLPMPQPEAYRTAAFDILQEHLESIYTNNLSHLQCLLLIIQSLEFASELADAWHFIGLATRLAISLGLHREASYASIEHSDEARKLFWTMYNLERNLCVVLDRPFSIPDTAITTKGPRLPSSSGLGIAENLIAYRQLESEIYQMTQESPALNGLIIDHAQWRAEMRIKLLAWHQGLPKRTTSSKLTPESFGNGALSNALLRVYFPSTHMPDPNAYELEELRHAAMDSIKSYRHSFRNGELRFYWRTLHFVYLAGAALAHGAKDLSTRMQLDYDTYSSIRESMDSCATVLWGMVERCPESENYRDRLDVLVSELTELKPIIPTDMYNFLDSVDFDVTSC